MRAFSEYYGATVPLKLSQSLDVGSSVFESFFFGLVGGIVIFASVLVLCTFCSFSYGNVAVTLICAAAVSVLAVLIRGTGGGAWRQPLASCGLAAVIFGWCFGRYCYCAYGYFALYYTNARTYENVDPLQPGASVADAGRLIFAAEAHVAIDKSAGYMAEDGITYCAAPIIGLAPATPHMEFWAVGTDCCGTVGDFKCHGVDNPEAHGGAVLLDRPSFGLGAGDTPDLVREHFHAARRAAEGVIVRSGNFTNSAAIVENAKARSVVYVLWVTRQNLAMLSRYYAEKAWVFIALATFAFTCLSAPLAWVVARHAASISQSLKPPAPPRARAF